MWTLLESMPSASRQRLKVGFSVHTSKRFSSNVSQNKLCNHIGEKPF